MIFTTRDQLEALPEPRLSREVLVPLFEAMGFQSVAIHHGGSGELGKDIVMWREEPPIDRVNYAVVVKATKLSGAAGVVGGVETQIRQALGSTFLDPRSLEPHRVDCCFLVCSKRIMKETRSALQAALLASGVQGASLRVFDGDELWHLMEKYLPSHLVWERFRSGYENLPAIPGHEIVVAVDRSSTAVTVLPASEGVAPLAIDPTGLFVPATESEDLRTRISSFVSEGNPVEFSTSEIAVERLPEFLKSLTPSDVTQLRFQTEESPFTLPWTLSLDFTCAGTTHRLQPPIELRMAKRGTESVTFSNKLQRIPILFELTFRPNSPVTTFRFQASLAGKSFHWLKETLMLMRSIASGADMVLFDWETGLRFASSGSDKRIEPPDEWLIDLCDRIDFIAQRLRTPVLVPARPYPSEEDLVQIEFLHSALSSGTLPQGSVKTLSLTLPLGDAKSREFFEKLRGGAPLRLRSRIPSLVRRLFDTDLELGPVDVECEGVVLAGGHVETERQSPLDASDEGTARVELRPGEGHEFTVRLARLSGAS